MSQITLIVHTAGESFEVPLDADAVTIGRDETAALVIDDAGLSRLHATIQRAGDEVWVTDENSTNGTQVNGEEISSEGFALRDGDEIALGDETTITVRIDDSFIAPTDAHAAPNAAARKSNMPPPHVLALIILAFVGITATIALGVYALATGGGSANNSSDITQTTPTPGNSQTATASPSPILSLPSPPSSPAPQVTPDIDSPPTNLTGGQARRTYRQMSDEEKTEFIARRARHISVMMTRSGRPYEFNDDVLRLIKHWVDAFANRVGSRSTRMWASDMTEVYGRGIGYAPLVIRSFEEARVSPIVGLYLPVIETEYNNIPRENHAGAMGLYQFIAPTARGYGLRPEDRTNVSLMAPAAARHIKENMIEFGDDSMSVAMAIAGYNRGTQSLLRDLRTVLNNNRGNEAGLERDFWTLIANKAALDRYFQDENSQYVPRFFAAAILGETPWAFGMDMNALSTYTTAPSTTPSVATR